MARKPEAQYVASVHKHLPANVYHEGMANDYRGGTPDQYYEGPGGALWVEYKFAPKLPTVVDLTRQTTSPKLSPLQMKWLERAYKNNVNVAVILGTPDGGYIFRYRDWLAPIGRDFLSPLLLPRKDIAKWIASRVGINA